MHGGSKQSDDDFEGENQLHVFDINTMSWSKPLRPDYHVEYRTGHMATCHKGNMIVLGGEQKWLSVAVSLTRISCGCIIATRLC